MGLAYPIRVRLERLLRAGASWLECIRRLGLSESELRGGMRELTAASRPPGTDLTPRQTPPEPPDAS